MTALEELITPHTGPVRAMKPVTDGFGVATTAVVEAELGQFFIKATPNEAGGNLDAAHREAAIGPHLGDAAPRFRFQVEDKAWFVIGTDALDARATDFTPGSGDLPSVVEAVNRITDLGLPKVAEEWEDTRWDRFATDEEKPHLRGDAFTHADLHGHNVLVDLTGRSWVVDWEWPTRASAAVMPSSLAIQLVSAGHTPESAESWVSQTNLWEVATEEELRVFAVVDVRMHQWFAKLRPEEKWLGAMLDAARAWHGHLKE
ncbi:protein kinase [Nocardiopsis sp. NRRL B-16309]|uniref:protein kinase n=1 Tax=Nocardiopsis sp. NRRL B-16309 TaxID=1519494 RepID=UPI0006B00716|nr:protein kinase [Nocardiopsis sp. NRRL B-16309]KOX15258.1 protein kinase [Nocardiopsis sp. NRRL B-16309]